MIIVNKGIKPRIGKALFVAPSADLIGDVTLGKDSSIWYQSAIRGDMEPIKIGQGSNVQEQSSLHVDIDAPLVIGDFVTVGHGVILHGCTIGNASLIGMGAIILNNSVIGKNSIVGAGSLVTEGKKFPDGSLIIGSPAKVVKSLSQEQINSIKKNAEIYIELAREAKLNNK